MKEKIGKRIREYREQLNISQETLGEKTGLSVVAISNIERGINYPTLEHFIGIANVLDISADLLLCDVVNASYISRTSDLSDKLSNVSQSKRNQILAMMELLLKTDG